MNTSAKVLLISLMVLICGLLYTQNSLQVFDYVVVGGGTSGLVVANRLVKRGASVLVLEAGPDSAHRDAVNVAGMFGSTLNSDIDWKYDLGLSIPMPRGRTLGGSSAVNFLLWNRPADIEIDAWEEMGAVGWNWDSLLEAMKQIETFHPPSEQISKLFGLDEQVDSQHFGSYGGIHLSYPRFATEVDKKWLESMKRLGNPSNVNSASGDNVGATVSPITMDPSDFSRSYSASAFLKPVRHMSNLTVLDGATVSRILTEKNSDGSVRATGVEYIHKGKLLNVGVRNKAVLAAGAISTPQVLELSGIGDRGILEKYGIETVMNQPNVGKNFQDHTYSTSVFELDNSVRSIGLVHSDPSIALEELTKLRSKELSLLEQANVCVAYLTPEQILDDDDKRLLSELMKEMETYQGEYKEQYEKQLEYLRSGKVTQSEYINVGFFADVHHAPEANKTYATLLAANQHAFARGSVHIKSTDPYTQPHIDHQYLSQPIDVLLQKAALKYTRKIAGQSPLSELVKREVIPGPQVTSNAEWEAFVREKVTGEYHPIGTAKMGRVEDGAVVDSKLKVHGTENIHIVDASVIPLHVSAHIQSVVYAIASRSTLYL
ncbi:hypothetical protein E3P86_00795 [Wallemia ichthyophaga]|uniref:Glucose-methanol-choline oxidoreductase N-terminal domain-containing protein n=1 Tax=Wallemia ichthyophaga TaxID=245174 RepID=A0A4V4M6N9_WALIC|nr:hypothetical protein E3P86_00795 [Wallemia ichthyophaga]